MSSVFPLTTFAIPFATVPKEMTKDYIVVSGTSSYFMLYNQFYLQISYPAEVTATFSTTFVSGTTTTLATVVVSGYILEAVA